MDMLWPSLHTRTLTHTHIHCICIHTDTYVYIYIYCIYTHMRTHPHTSADLCISPELNARMDMLPQQQFLMTYYNN
jgi:hypothetical protein